MQGGENKMKFYDFAKAKEIAMKLIEKKGVTSIGLGTKSDWFWTSEEIWNKTNGFLIDLDTAESIGGINGSFWDTPVLRAFFDDGHVEEWGVQKQCIDSKEHETLCERQNERRKKMLEKFQQLEEEK